MNMSLCTACGSLHSQGHLCVVDLPSAGYEVDCYGRVVPTGEKDDLRLKRNRLLSESDWTQIPDTGLSAIAKVEWTAYRQQLRDLPKTGIWPLEPKK